MLSTVVENDQNSKKRGQQKRSEFLQSLRNIFRFKKLFSILKMAEFVAGSIEDCPVFNFDWVIKVAEFDVEADKESPVFKVQDIPFQLACFRGIYSGWLFSVNCPVEEPLSFAMFSLHLVGSDGSLKKIITMKNASFEVGGTTFLDVFELDKLIFPDELDPKFLPNGELRIRCHVEIKTNEAVGAEPGVDGPVQDSALARDLRKEVGTHKFSDFTLVIIVSFCSISK